MRYSYLKNICLQQNKSHVSDFVYRLAQKKYETEKFDESLEILDDVFSNQKHLVTNSSYTIRDAAILYAKNLEQLTKYIECREWLEEAKNNALIPENDLEADLIDLWVQIPEGKYRNVLGIVNSIVEVLQSEFNPLLGEYLFLRGYINSRLGFNRNALDDCKVAIAIFKILNKYKDQAVTSNVIGIIYLQLSQYSEAIKWFKLSLALNSDLGITKKVAYNNLNIGIVFYKLALYNDAYEYLSNCIHIIYGDDKKIDLWRKDVYCLAKIALGNVCRLRCEYTEARKHLMRAYTLATKQRMPREECLSLEFLGDVFRDEGKPQEALRYYARGKAIAQEIAPEGDLIMELWRREGECLQLMDDIAQAMPILARARSLASKLGDRFEEGVIHRCQAACAAKISDWESAGKYIRDSIDLLEEIEARHELAISYLQAANIYSAQAKDVKQRTKPHILLEDAWNNGLAAQHIFLKLGIEEWLERAKHTISAIAKQRVAEARHRPFEVVGESYAPPENKILAVSMAMRNVLQMCDAFAGHDEAVLITGETGTGKELIARRLHEMSNRRRKPFVALNAAAIPANMFEREFFGHHKGAFTGAEHDQHGYAAEADGGTLFLDEIAELPLELQPKLLRLLQEGTYLALGSPDLKHADVRLLAATNANLKRLVDQGKFRQDLFYRLRILEIEIPPLRERPEDIVPLLNHFLSKSAGRQATVSEYFDEVSIQAMLRHEWEGNVREIAMTARRAHISMAAEGRVRIELGLPPNVVWLTGPEGIARAAVAGAADKDVFRSRILVLLEETGGNRSETARRLGISRPTLYRWMKRFNIKS